MLYDFLTANRTELIARCRARVAARRSGAAVPHELDHGVSLFLDQFTAMLPGGATDPGSGGETPEHPASLGEAQIRHGAARHGTELLINDYSIGEVVRDYGDLCQAITQLAIEDAAPITVAEFGILNIRLDNAIAGAVTEFTRPGQRLEAANDGGLAADQRLSALAYEMRNLLNTSILAISAIKSGSVGFHGATATALDRSLIGMRALIDSTLAEVRIDAGSGTSRETIELGPFILQIQVAAALEAARGGRELTVLPTEPGVFVEGDRHILTAAVANLLHNAFQLTSDASHVLLRAYAKDGRVYIEVEDSGADLLQDMLDQVFRPDRADSGLGLAVSRKGVEGNGGKLYARNVAGRGCVCVIELEQKAMPAPNRTAQ